MKVAGAGAAWDEPSVLPRAVLLLAHGAGGDLNDAFLRGVGAALAGSAVATLRFNLPYRDAGRRAPGSQTQSEDGYRAVASEARRQGIPFLCGGKSYGGRIATHIVSDGLDVDGLVLLSYPLHAPGRPDKLKDAHLAAIQKPMLFIQGTRDPFATPELLRKTVAALDTATLEQIEGGDHSLNVKGRKRAEVIEEVVGAIGRFVERLS